MTSHATAVEQALGQKPPRLSGGLPLIGHVVEFGRDPMKLFSRAREENGEICSFSLINQEMVFLCSPDGHETFFRAADEDLSFEPYNRLVTPLFGEGIVYDAPPGMMAQQVGFLMHSLRDKRMRTYSEKVAEEVEKFVDGWGEGGVIDLADATRELTTYTSTRCLLGDEFRNEMTDEFAKVYHDLEAGVIPLAYINSHLPLPVFRRRDKARERLNEMIGSIIKRRRSRGTVGEDLIQTLMESKYKDDKVLTEHEIVGLVLATIFAGHHTSSVLSAWTGIELLKNPEFLPAIREEVDGLLPDGERPSYLTLRQMTKLENAIKEAGRLHPPLVMLMRKLVVDMPFKEFTMPAGAYVVTSPYVAHRIPELFPEPERFNPERFETDEHGLYDLIIWGGGRHKCVGMHFALMQIKALWSTLLRRYDFELLQDSYEPDFTRMVVGPKAPCRIRYRRRRNWN